MKTDRVRTTISLSPEVHEIFKRMADVAGTSVSRCMGDWLADTGEAAEMITTQLEKARQAPMDALREMRQLLAGMGQQASQVQAELDDLIGVEKKKAAPKRTARPQPREDGRSGFGAAAAAKPPSSNTGVLVPSGQAKPRGGKSLKSSPSKGRKS
jgi:hypothetical protein